jgi:hypothetical protein
LVPAYLARTSLKRAVSAGTFARYNRPITGRFEKQDAIAHDDLRQAL